MYIKSKDQRDIFLNGWKFELIIDKSKYDITKSIKNIINKDYILEINESFDFKQFISKPIKNYKSSYLKISNPRNKFWDPLTIKEFTSFKMSLRSFDYEKKIDMVYFINSDLTNSFSKLFRDQLRDLIKSKIFKYPNLKLHIVIICSSINKREKIKQFLKRFNLNKYFDYFLYFSSDQNKEYAGIKKVWDLSIDDPNKYILYFHGKGLSYISNSFFYIRQPLEKLIFRLLVTDWRKNLEKISRIYSIDKIGILSGGTGWLWFNFWIARSSYLRFLDKPIKTKTATYYEAWLGRCKYNQNSELKQIYKHEKGEKFLNTVNQTISLLNNPKREKYNLGSVCKVESGGFVGLGIVKYTYRLWYLFFVILNRLGINKGPRERFLFF